MQGCEINVSWKPRDYRVVFFIQKYGEDDEHPHRTYDRSIQFSADGTIAYFCLIAACAAARRAMGTRKGEQET